jgi:NADPH:quinone reductase
MQHAYHRRFAETGHRYFRTGLYKAELPLITGKEAAGTIAAVHSSVEGYKEGDKVCYLGDHTYAQYSAVPAYKVVHVPDGITTEAAAASYLQGLTGVTLIKEAAQVKQALGLSEGEWVLVHAAAGGTGTQLVQMLKPMGAKIIGTAGGKEKMELAKQNGATWVLDSKEDDLVAKVKEITGGHGVDVIFDGVGKVTFDRDLEMIARKGRLIMFGNAVSRRDQHCLVIH